MAPFDKACKRLQRRGLAFAASLLMGAAAPTIASAVPVYSNGAAAYSNFTIEVVDLTPDDGLAAGWSYGNGGLVNRVSELSVLDRLTGEWTDSVENYDAPADLLQPYTRTLPHPLALQHTSSSGPFDGSVDAAALNGATSFSAYVGDRFTLVVAPFSRLLLGVDLYARAQGQDHAGVQDILDVGAIMSVFREGDHSFPRIAEVGFTYYDGNVGYSIDATASRRGTFAWSNDGATPVELAVRLAAIAYASDGSPRVAATVPLPGTLALAAAGLLALMACTQRRVAAL